MRTVFSTLVIAAFLLQSPSAQQAAAPAAVAGPPKLVVFISVDQMRGDYVDKFQQQWTKGLKRLVTDGAWFRQAEYPYYNTVTCAGHASMSTGAVPAVHGMVLNQWWENGATKMVECTDDESQQLITYGIPVKGTGQSAQHLMSTTIADEMRLQLPSPPHVASISLKARSAINLGGHHPDVVQWLDEVNGEWVTSTAFAKVPVPFIADYIKAHPLRNEIGRVWDRSLPKDKYLYDGSIENRQKTALATRTFPHVVKGAGNEVGGAWTDAWESSPYSDEYLAGLAMASMDALKLGRGASTDFLGISFSALDKVGHDFGPDSHEVQDVLVRLDSQVGLLLDKLDRDVGRGNYVLALTADHGVSPVPERLKAQGFDAGRVNTVAVGRTIDEVLARELGPGAYRTRVIYNDVYFNDGVYFKLTQSPKAMDAVLSAVRAIPGVWRVDRKETVLAAGDSDRLTRAAALSHYEGRSGDMKIFTHAYWITSTSTTTHGTGHHYDTHVPVILFGRGIKKGEYLMPSSPLDLAPTLAFLSGVTLPDATGRVLAEALEGRK